MFVTNGVLRGAGDVLADSITWLYNTLGAFGGAVFGLLYAPITLTGMHHSFIPIETQLLAATAITGGSFIFITASMNNVAQGAAVIAVLLLTKNEKMKSICTASGVSAFLGITEPAMFGVTLKLRYPFYAAMIGSAVGSAYCALFKVLAQALGAAGIPGFISVNPSDWMNFGIGLILSIVTSFVLTIVLWKKNGLEKESEEVKENEEVESKEVSFQETKVFSPMNGKVSSITKSNDEEFASKAMGDGIVIDPIDGDVYAPADVEVKFVFPTKHAIGLSTQSGLDIMIHCGINTVNLEGEGFEIFVESGQTIKKGEKLLSYDLALVKDKGCDIQTAMVFTNANDKEVVVMEDANATITTQVALVK
ncbi:MAG: PTS beta-glucoside transporter subunit IIBCA, partial [Erysipelotrichia bacterium]|nr:PTS beta-glucoside transporter subunit IIBCA [Erysipelotrichia bacterium]